MKNIVLKFKSIGVKVFLMSALLFTACDQGFDEMNENPNAYTTPDIGTLFTTSVIRTVGTGTEDRNRINIKYLSGAMQYHATLNDFWYGEKGIVHSQSGNFFETVYTDHMMNLVEVISATTDDPETVNQNAIAKIWKVYTLHRVTDAYGDVPYQHASVGSVKGIHKPVYDQQSDIYPWMLEDLESALNQLDPSKASFGAADVIYGGDVEKWSIFGNSLMLRLGLRLSNVDPALSQQWVQKAISGGVMQSNEDIALLEHSSAHGNTWNWDARELKRESFPESNQGTGLVKMAKTFIDILHENDDPRIPFFVTLWEGNIDALQGQVITETTKPELQKGLPNGYDQGTIDEVIPNWSSTMLTDYSEPNTATIANLASPSIILSYSEVEFLLAEAALRGWEGGTPQEHYHKAIRANMETSYLFPNNTLEPMAINEAEISAYLGSHPLTGDLTEQMEQIHTQFYIAHYMYLDFFEAWSNWRRTGVPELAPINYPLNTTGGEPIRRLMYSVEELALNAENVEAAISNQGPDTYSTRVWWDVEE